MLDRLIAKYVEEDKKALKRLVQKWFVIHFQKQDNPLITIYLFGE